jgi:predicted glycosyltransferase
MTQPSRPRILYYCLSLVGIGHLAASLQIINELLNHADVNLIYSGINYTHFPQHNGFRLRQLPPLLFNEAGELFSPDKALSVDEVWQQRSHTIHNFLTCPYQGIVVEFYPFGRRKFKREIREMVKLIKASSGDIPVFSQVREVLVPSDAQGEREILAIIDREIHTVLVRGDPAVVKFDDTFRLTPELGDRLFYGGYISPPCPEQHVTRAKRIIVSQGGGNVGQQLLLAAIQIAHYLTDYHFIIATGSGSSPADIAYLQSFIQSKNIEVVPFLPDFRKHLQSAALSINMGGDNTLLDMIATRTPSLAFPYPGNSEQTLRIEKLAQQGWVTAIYEADLNPQPLKQHILVALDKPYPTTTMNLNGAQNIAQKILEIIKHF